MRDTERERGGKGRVRGKQSVASAGKQRLRRSEASAVQRVSDDDDEVLNVKSQTHTLTHTHRHSHTLTHRLLHTPL